MSNRGIFSISEVSELDSKNLESPDGFKEEGNRKIEIDKILAENSKLRIENRELTRSLEILTKEKDSEKVSIVEEMTFFGRGSSFGPNIESTRNSQGISRENYELREKLEEIDTENSKLKTEIINLHKTIIELKQECSGIRGISREYPGPLFFTDDMTPDSQMKLRYKEGISNTPSALLQNIPKNRDSQMNLQNELEAARIRNFRLEEMLEEIKEKEQQTNFFYQVEQEKIINSYKTLYEMYARKKKDLDGKENQILSISRIIKQDIDDAYLNKHNGSARFVFWLVVTIIFLCFLIFSKKQLFSF